MIFVHELLLGSFEGQECENRLYLLDDAKYRHMVSGYYETRMQVDIGLSESAHKFNLT